jgi:glycosyltransferase involved in cell wall biosynthesis
MKKILLISNNEICYNARLLKAADFFHKNGWEVTVFNGVTGLASREIYEDIKKSRPWRIIENDISKGDDKSKFKWLITSLLHKFIEFSIDKMKLPFWKAYYLNKSLLLRPKLTRVKYDFILIHLVDNLPFAIQLKNKLNAQVIYDNQEYFVGQYAAFEKDKFNWVKEVQKKHLAEVDILLATTNVMLNQLRKDHDLKIPSFRVRNVPSMQTTAVRNDRSSDQEFDHLNVLKLVWHGMGIYFNNRRGVHILLHAIAQCNANVHLYLQGNLTETQKSIYESCENSLNLKGKVTFLPPAHPDQIVPSLTKFDVGLTAELPEELNQELTSSNKLFDYIHAGLAIISSDVLGLAETIDEFDVGLKYEPGNVAELSDKIDQLAADRTQLNKFKQNSKIASSQLFWELDYSGILQLVKKAEEQ